MTGNLSLISIAIINLSHLYLEFGKENNYKCPSLPCDKEDNIKSHSYLTKEDHYKFYFPIFKNIKIYLKYENRGGIHSFELLKLIFWNIILLDYDRFRKPLSTLFFVQVIFQKHGTFILGASYFSSWEYNIFTLKIFQIFLCILVWTISDWRGSQ